MVAEEVVYVSSRKRKQAMRALRDEGATGGVVPAVPLRVVEPEPEPEKREHLPDWMYETAEGKPRNVTRGHLRYVAPAATRPKPTAEEYDLTGAHADSFSTGSTESDEQLMNLLDPRQGLRTYALSLLKQQLTARGSKVALQSYDVYTDFLRALDKVRHPAKQDKDGTVHLPRYLPSTLWDGLAEMHSVSVATVRRRVQFAEAVLLRDVSITLS